MSQLVTPPSNTPIASSLASMKSAISPSVSNNAGASPRMAAISSPISVVICAAVLPPKSPTVVVSAR